jgi:hypothetical protein
MKRNDFFSKTEHIDYQDAIQRIAFHEAGHAAGIHLYNKEKRLPSVFFQILLKETADMRHPTVKDGLEDSLPFIAEIEGGRLIEAMPLDLLESIDYFSITSTDAYQTAFEADIINLLIGAVSEAKHIALRDKGFFDVEDITLSSLHRYGGTSDLEEAYNYLESSIASKQRREEKIAELFHQAVGFIAKPAHWRAIEHLAGYLLTHKENTVSCENAIAVLEGACLQQ